MLALLEDAYRVAEFLNLDNKTVNKIGNCRYLVEVTELYQAWLLLTIDKLSHAKVKLHSANQKHLQQRLTNEPMMIHGLEDWMSLSQIQQHVWLTDYVENAQQSNEAVLVAWQDEEGIWAALTEAHLPEKPQESHQTMRMHSIARVRGLENCLAGAKQLSTLHLWQASRVRQD